MKLTEFKKAIKFYNQTGCVRPKNKKRYVGVEIECVFPMMKEGTILLSQEFIKAGLEKKVRMGDDGSITHKYGQCDLEVRVLDTEKEIFSTINKVCRILKSIGCYVNRSCGLHVHLDMRGTTDSEQEHVFNNLFKAQNFLYSLCSKNRERRHYCRKLKQRVTIMTRTKYDPIQNRYIFIPAQRVKMSFEVAKLQSRRTGINVCSLDDHETFELRMHEGTLNSAKINNWIKILLAIKNKKEQFKKPLPIKNKGMKELELS